MAVRPIPENYHSVTPYLIVRGGAQAIDFYQRAFNAVETLRLSDAAGRVQHAEIKIGDSPVMLADEFPEMNIRGPQSYGGTTVSLLLYVEDVDARYAQAIAAGAKAMRPVANQFYGDRAGTLEDPFGHVWSLASRKENLSPEEIQRRFAALVPKA
jgi:PhnB protein